MTRDGRRVVVGISGASGIAYGVRVLELLRQCDIESHLVVTKSGNLTRALELDLSAAELLSLASVVHRPADFSASIASGSFRTMGMIVAPCSMHSLAEIATGVTTNLLTRAAEVTLKERRPLVLMVRETPLTLTHLRNMVTATENGAIIAPPVPALYTRPAAIADVVTYSAARALDLLSFEIDIPRWGGASEPASVAPADDRPATSFPRSV